MYLDSDAAAGRGRIHTGVSPSVGFGVSLALYAVITAVLGRDILAHLGSKVAGDLGDPLLNAAILHWNATHLPYTSGWYQLPMFFPTRDTLLFSEHLLGLSVIATPLSWLSGDPIATLNLTLLLTFFLSAAAMYALVWRLTSSPAPAFIAGLAFGFAPYRIPQLGHVQMLAAFYAPLVLLGLHAYLDTRRRRWLVLFGAAWMLQAAANGYMLVYLSVLVGVWLLWFVVAKREWRALFAICGAMAVAALPLVPLLLRYIEVHAANGFVRPLEEVKAYSADVNAVLCAQGELTFWGWVQVGCRSEGELFPGVAFAALIALAAGQTLAWGRGAIRDAAAATRAAFVVLLAVGTAYGLIAATVWWFGPWRLAIGAFSATASSVGKPLYVAIFSVIAAMVVPLVARLWARRSLVSFYLLAGAVMWLLTLGPRLRVLGRSLSYDGPYALLMFLPGVNGLRVPARFWMLAILCFAVAVGLFLARVLADKRTRFAVVAVPAIALAVLADGWVAQFRAVPLPPPLPNAGLLTGRLVLQVPVTLGGDVLAVYHAVVDGWRTVNGYSGYEAVYYPALREAADVARSDSLFDPLRAIDDLAVIVPSPDTDYQAFVARQPGASVIARDANWTVFTLPRRVAAPTAPAAGRAVAIREVAFTCDGERRIATPSIHDGPLWGCSASATSRQVTIDLGRSQAVSELVHAQRLFFFGFPRRLEIETSGDGARWEPAWSGDLWGRAVAAGMADPRRAAIRVPFESRPARYIRLRQLPAPQPTDWVVGDLEVIGD